MDHYGMFTVAGGKRVAEIIDEAEAASNTLERQYEIASVNLKYLSLEPKFGEATDTVVREEVWTELREREAVKVIAQMRAVVRPFVLRRLADVSGVSGTGIVVAGTEFGKNGWVAMTWLGDKSSYCWYPSVKTMMAVHGHDGQTELVWLDGKAT